MPTRRIEWLDEARADVRRLDRATAMRIFDAILHHANTGGGDIKPLQGDLSGAFRLRVGDWRVLFALRDDVLQIFGVRHRREAYK